MAKKTTPKNIISVTRAHIKKGLKGSCGNCPIALALDSVSEIYMSYASPYRLIMDHVEYRTPRSCIRFMTAFDAGKKVKPFRFKLVPKEDV